MLSLALPDSIGGISQLDTSGSQAIKAGHLPLFMDYVCSGSTALLVSERMFVQERVERRVSAVEELNLVVR